MMTGSMRRLWRLSLFSLVWLVIAAGRVLKLSLTDKELHVDEVWSVWQLLGREHTYSRDANWPPLYVMLIDVWHRLVGIHPIVLRYFSVLLLLIGASVVYRIMVRLHGHTAGLLGMIAYSAVPMGIFQTTEVRGYSLVYALFPIALWLSMRYFDQPTLRRAIPLGFVMSALFYTTYSSAGALLVLAMYWLIVYYRQFWRWWLPAIVAGLVAAPQIVEIADLALGRQESLAKQVNLGPFFSALEGIYRGYAGDQVTLCLIIVVIAALSLLLKRYRDRRAWALVAWALFPAVLYLAEPLIGLFNPNYSWFVLLGIALLVGWGLSYLPRVGQVVAAGMLLFVMLSPVPYDNYQAQGAPIGSSLEWLADHAQWGDVVYIDPGWNDPYCPFREDCINAEVWDYMIDIYFPQGLAVVDDPTGYRRVWYLKVDGWQDPEAEQLVVEGRIPGRFVGPWTALFRLYEAPPDATGILFENGMRFHGMDVLDDTPRPLVRHEGDTIHVRLWWSVDEPLAADYSVSLQVLRNGKIIVQVDGAPQPVDGSSSQTSTWQPGQFYVEERVIQLPKKALASAYDISLTVYQWWDGVRIPAPETDESTLLRLRTLYIKSWDF